MILNTTKKPRLRYRVIPGNMGNFGEPANSPNHKFVVVSGVDRGNGYQGASSVSHFLAAGFGPPEARQNLIRFLAVRGYNDWLAQQGIAVPASVKGRARVSMPTSRGPLDATGRPLTVYRTRKRPGDPTYSAEWSGVTGAPRCRGTGCGSCGNVLHHEGDSHYCPTCDDYKPKPSGCNRR